MWKNARRASRILCPVLGILDIGNAIFRNSGIPVPSFGHFRQTNSHPPLKKINSVDDFAQKRDENTKSSLSQGLAQTSKENKGPLSPHTRRKRDQKRRTVRDLNPRYFRTLVFKTSAFDRSANCPKVIQDAHTSIPQSH